ncbi:hypothetical protein FHX08_000308 [Rhizobium sp. BK529]|jgi:hypothetical protein|nr:MULTISPECIES: hypothetical protein [unclassified Rhizobium]MBB3589964.1 hypothetical protein [Rhizobium sp. BK529]
MKFPRPQPIDSDIITCFSCNFELGTYGSIKKKMVAMLNRVAAAEQQQKKH